MRNLPDDSYNDAAESKKPASSREKKTYKDFCFKINSSTDQITRMIQRFDDFLENNNCCSPRTKSELSTALSEALANAIIHGNQANPEKFVDIKIQLYDDRMILKVKDKGPGFDYKKLPNPLRPENIKKRSGRGIYLMSVLVDKVKFIQHPDGMEVILIKQL